MKVWKWHRPIHCEKLTKFPGSFQACYPLYESSAKTKGLCKKNSRSHYFWMQECCVKESNSRAICTFLVAAENRAIDVLRTGARHCFDCIGLAIYVLKTEHSMGILTMAWFFFQQDTTRARSVIAFVDFPAQTDLLLNPWFALSSIYRPSGHWRWTLKRSGSIALVLPYYKVS